MVHDVPACRASDPSHLTESFSRLLRRELAGGVRRVLGRDEEQVTIGLFTSDAGEELDPFTSADEELLAVVDKRGGSEEVAPPNAEGRGPG